MNMEIRDCNSVVDGFHYTIGTKWLYVCRGASKKYRISLLEYENRKALALITLKNDGKSRTREVMEFVMEKGEKL